MFGIVRESLEIAADYYDEFGYLPSEHHFYVSFLTSHPGVIMPAFLKRQYPHEITIVIQHQFEDLEVDEDCLCVTLSFNGKNEFLRVPFDALTSFADPSVKFGLQFKSNSLEVFEKNITNFPDKGEILYENLESKSKKPAKESNIITLDDFKKK